MRSRKKRNARGARIKLAPGVRFDSGEEQEEVLVLVCPDGKVQLNQIAAGILRLCDGSRTRDDLVAEVVRRSQGPARVAEIIEFLDVAHARGWIDGE